MATQKKSSSSKAKSRANRKMKTEVRATKVASMTTATTQPLNLGGQSRGAGAGKICFNPF